MYIFVIVMIPFWRLSEMWELQIAVFDDYSRPYTDME